MSAVSSSNKRPHSPAHKPDANTKKISLSEIPEDLINPSYLNILAPTTEKQDSPFPVCVLSDFLAPDFFEQLRQEIQEKTLGEEFTWKCNDLYQFRHCNNFDTPALKTWHKLVQSSLYSRIISKMCDGLELLQDKVDINMQEYQKGGHLLCHDDDIKESDFVNGKISIKIGRKVAFILYLVDDQWKEEDGGLLDLFPCEEQLGYPLNQYTRSIVPVANQLAFFPVTETSYHQVREVLRSKPPYRLSISGWLYGPVKEEAQPKNFALEKLISPMAFTIEPRVEVNWTTLVSDYFDYSRIKTSPNTKFMFEAMKCQFCDQSCIEINGFLKTDIYNALKQALSQNINDADKKSSWNLLGPPNFRRFYELNQELTKRDDSTNDLIKEVREMLQSKQMKEFLGHLTTLSCFALTPVWSRYYSPGCYQLLRDDYNEPLGLDVTLVVQLAKSPESDKGETVYVQDECEEPLIQGSTTGNMLRVCWRNEENIRRFIRYLDHDETGLGGRVEFGSIWSVTATDE